MTIAVLGGHLWLVVPQCHSLQAHWLSGKGVAGCACAPGPVLAAHTGECHTFTGGFCMKMRSGDVLNGSSS